jgi:hypothetical protein
MSDFLNALKADLLDRRVLPILALVGALLLAAVIYAVAGGGSSASTPGASITTPATPAGLAVRESQPSSSRAVAETTSGTSVQRHGFAHDPFSELPGAKPASSTASAATTTASAAATTATSGSSTSSSGGSSTSSESSSGSSSKGESTPTPSKSSAPSKPKTVYVTSVLFGLIPPGTPAASVPLIPYNDLKLMTAFPSAKQPLIVFRGVTAGGKSASFTIVGEVILHGKAACRPSPTQCQEINLKPSQSEQLEYLEPSGQVDTYELRIVSIVKKQAAAASASRVRAHLSRAGRRVLESAGLTEVPGLRFSAIAGVVTSVPQAVVRASAW